MGNNILCEELFFFLANQGFNEYSLPKHRLQTYPYLVYLV